MPFPTIKKVLKNLDSHRIRRIIDLLAKAYPNAWCSLEYKNPFQLMVGSILSAQCTNKQVNKVTKELYKKYKTAKDFARANPEELARDIKSTGFYRQKSISVVGACQDLVERHGGRVPRTMDELLSLTGVGRKTANLILSTGYGLYGMVVNTHMIRLAQRLGLTKHVEPENIEQDLRKVIPQKEWTLFSHRISAHGRAVCHARAPRCGACVLKDLCPSREI